MPAAELTLLSLVEFGLGPIWVWLLLSEAPTALSLAGGLVVFTAIAGWSWVRMREIAPAC